MSFFYSLVLSKRVNDATARRMVKKQREEWEAEQAELRLLRDVEQQLGRREALRLLRQQRRRQQQLEPAAPGELRVCR